METIWTMIIFQLYYLLKTYLQNEIFIQIKKFKSQELNVASIEQYLNEPPPEYTPEYPPAYHLECPPPYTLIPINSDEPETLHQWNNPVGSNQTQLLNVNYGYI